MHMHAMALHVHCCAACDSISKVFVVLQTYNFSNANPNLNYSSPLFHHVVLQNLTPSTLYFYKCGDPTLGMSGELNFTSPPAVGDTSYPMVLGVVADTGLTPNTTVTIQHLVDSKPQVWTLIGDFS